MSNEIEKLFKVEPTHVPTEQPRKLYCKPRLNTLGDLRTLTLGGTGLDQDISGLPGEFGTLNP
jgi:hypothetical protein